MANEDTRKATGSPQGTKILAEPLPQVLSEIDDSIKKAADAAVKAAVEEANKQLEESKKSIEEIAKKAEEALARSADSLSAEVVKKALKSWQFTSTLILFFLATLFASVTISLAISLAIH